MFSLQRPITKQVLNSRLLSNSVKKSQEKQTAFTLSTPLNKLKEREHVNNRDVVSNNFQNNMEGQVTYDPFDFSIAKIKYQSKISTNVRNQTMKTSSFNAPEINPLDFYCLPHLLSQYLSTGGMIQHRSVTGLKPHKHKQMAKAVKRSRAAGFLSCVSRDVSFAPKRGSTL